MVDILGVCGNAAAPWGSTVCLTLKDDVLIFEVNLNWHRGLYQTERGQHCFGLFWAAD